MAKRLEVASKNIDAGDSTPKIRQRTSCSATGIGKTGAREPVLSLPKGLDSDTRQSTAKGEPTLQPSLYVDSENRGSLPGALLPRAFFEAPPEQVSPRLLGKILVHRTEGANGTQSLAGRIVEVEAYLGPHNTPPDPAAHSYRGPTPRNQVLFGHAGHAYVYAIYGRYFCMNITCESEGLAGCILIRALEPLTGLEQMARNRGLAAGTASRDLTSGPGRLCQALGLTRNAHNFLDLTDPCSPLQVRDDGSASPQILITPRIGISAAVDWPLRFAIPGHACVSGPTRLRVPNNESCGS